MCYYWFIAYNFYIPIALKSSKKTKKNIWIISCLGPNSSDISKMNTKDYYNILPMYTFKGILTMWE